MAKYQRTYRESDRISYFANINERSAPVVNHGYSPSRFNGKSRYGQDDLFKKIQEETRKQYGEIVRAQLKLDD